MRTIFNCIVIGLLTSHRGRGISIHMFLMASLRRTMDQGGRIHQRREKYDVLRDVRDKLLLL